MGLKQWQEKWMAILTHDNREQVNRDMVVTEQSGKRWRITNKEGK